MDIVIMGAGAIGSLFGGYIAHNTDNRVHFIGRSSHMQAIQKEGLQIEGLSKNVLVKNIHACIDAGEIGPADLVILTVKAYDTKQALLDARKLFTEATFLLCLQNGLGIEDIASDVLGDNSRIIRGTTTNGALVIKPGTVKHTGQGETAIGSLTQARLPILNEIQQIFNQSGFPTTISDDIESLIWKKIMVNVGINPLGAITGLQNGYLQDGELLDVMSKLIEEAVFVAKAYGLSLSVEESLQKTIEVCQKTFKNRNSMLQDIEKRRPTEIDYINGAIVRMGKRVNVPTPLNQMITALIKGIERANN
ncbi:MAG: ketopantoate reductase family protein [Candidatus Helarchaeota archaeon]